MPTTTARNYFEQYTGTDAVALLQSLPGANPNAFENEWLDFKSGKAVNDPSKLEKLWSKAVGAFANNEGGVLIFGIDARPDSTTGIDAAGLVEEVPDVNWLVSKLTELSRFATDPPLSHIEYKALPLNDSTSKGFVVCLIPEGKTKPYRSEKDGKRFLIRTGDSAIEPTVSLLRQLFYPQYSTKAVLKMAIIAEPFGRHAIQAGPKIVQLNCELSNTGDTTIQQANIAFHGMGVGFAKVGEDMQLRFGSITGFPLKPYMHPSHSGYCEIYAQASGANIQHKFVVTVYQLNTQAITRLFGIDFTDGYLISEGKEATQVEVPFTID